MRLVISIFCLVSVTFAQIKHVEKYQGPLQKSQSVPQVTIDTTAQVKIAIPLQPQIDKSKLSLYIPWKLVEGIHLSAYVDTHFVLLKWTAMKNAKGYNLYRRPEGGTYKKINSKLITWPTDQKKATQMYDKLMPLAQYKLERAHIRKATQSEFYPQFTDKTKESVFHYLGNLYYQIALIVGQAYADSTVQSGKVYYYRIKYIDKNGVEKDFANEVKVTAGAVKKLTKPTGLKAEAGDSKILLVWNDPPPTDTLAGYHVYQSKSPIGPFKRINATPVLTTIAVSLKGDSLKPPQYGFLDTTVVNYTTYYYRIAPRNLLGRLGPMSTIVSAKPIDLTPPQLPQNLNITPLQTNMLLITWNWVNKDVRKRGEVVKRYQIFRYTDYNSAIADTAATSKYSIGFVTEPWSQPGVHLIGDTVRSFSDKNVIPEQVYWYRISCEDTAGNVSHKTAALSGILPDYEPPDSPEAITAEGFDDYIRISWKPPNMTKKKNQDLAGYMLYRGICGGYHEVIERDEGNIYVYHAYPLHLLTDITDKDSTTYKDYSIPKGSPICYRYALRAYDKAQNLSAMSDSVCERLRDKTPPDPPVITALKAREGAIKIECVAAPIQDMKGFIIERSESKDSGYKIVYSDSIPKSVACGDIPSSVDTVLAKKANQVSYVDKNVDPEKVYWYRVRAFDHNGNKSKPSPSISTYTFEIKSLPKPVNLKADLKKQRDGSCSVELSWETGISRYPKSFLGFVVFRSFAKNHGYRQISQPSKDMQFIDTAVAPGMTCWYKVQAFDSNGDRSPTSDSVSITITE